MNVKISEAEWEVMVEIWKEHPLTGTEIANRLAERRQWKNKTVKTMINRLVNKGAVKYSTRSNCHYYSPKISQDECVRKESRSFLERVFGGDPAPMLAYFVKEENLSKRDIEKLRRLLSEKEKNRKN